MFFFFFCHSLLCKNLINSDQIDPFLLLLLLSSRFELFGKSEVVFICVAILYVTSFSG